MRLRHALLLPLFAAALACGGSDDSGSFTPASGAGMAGSAGSVAAGSGGSAGSGSQAGLGGAGGAGGGLVCAPGQQVACACPGGAQGAQACKGDGSGYEACVCPMGTGGAGAAGGAGKAGGAGCPSPVGWYEGCTDAQWKDHCFSNDCAAFKLNTPKCVLEEQWAGHNGLSGNPKQAFPPTLGDAFVICF